MLYKTKYFLRNRLGEQVIRKKFLWYPKSFKNDMCGRFWTWEDIVYEVVKIDVDWGQSIYCWKPIRFATDEDYNLIPFEKVSGKRYKLSDYKIYLDIIAMLIFLITFNLTGFLISCFFLWYDTISQIIECNKNEM